jgi:hypothetical protein
MVSAATFDAFSFWTFSGMTFLIIGMSGAAWRFRREETPSEVAVPVGAS